VRDLLLIKTSKKERRKSDEDGCTKPQQHPQQPFTKKLKICESWTPPYFFKQRRKSGEEGRVLDVQQIHGPSMVVNNAITLTPINIFNYVVSSRVMIPIWDTHPLFTFALWFPLGSQQGHTPYGYLSIYQHMCLFVWMWLCHNPSKPWVGQADLGLTPTMCNPILVE